MDAHGRVLGATPSAGWQIPGEGRTAAPPGGNLVRFVWGDGRAAIKAPSQGRGGRGGPGGAASGRQGQRGRTRGVWLVTRQASREARREGEDERGGRITVFAPARSLVLLLIIINLSSNAAPNGPWAPPLAIYLPRPADPNWSPCVLTRPKDHLRTA